MTVTNQTVGAPGERYYEGDTLEIRDNVDTPDGSAKDLSGASISFEVVDRFGESPALSDADSGVTAAVTDAAAGEITISVDSGVTDGLIGDWHYLIRVEISGKRTVVTTGDLIVQPR